MTRLFLAAGVAAMAIAVPASAKPGGGGGHGGGGGQGAAVFNGGGRGGGGGHGGGGFQMRAMGGGGHAPANFGGGFSAQRHGGGFAAPRMQRQAFAPQNRGHGGGAGAIQTQRGNAHAFRMTGSDRRVERGNVRPQRVERMQARNFERQQSRVAHGQQARIDRGQQMRIDRGQLAQSRGFDRGQLRNQGIQDRAVMRDQIRGAEMARIGTRDWQNVDRWAGAQGLANGCPPGLWAKNNGCLPPGQANKLVGQSVRDAERSAALNELPIGIRAFYPDTPDYYYRYGDGYLYQVDRSSSLIDALLPLIGGGYVPGMMFPSSYINSYAPGYTFPMGYADPYVTDYYGFNSFYPDTAYTDYRYLNGNVYGVDPYSGMIQDVIPTYAYGYGVGQVLPASYGYYNVPYQYRDLYYDTSDYNYWYAPGAIYQVDPSSQMITSVASLLSPGLSIGQPLPMGYDVYNVPLDYRATYYDTPTAWYRYNNGYIYQVDPTTQLVTAIVASILT